MEQGISLITELGHKARRAAFVLSQVDIVINNALSDLEYALRTNAADIMKVNTQDVVEAHTKGLTQAAIDRLTLTPARIEDMADNVAAIRKLPNPCNIVLEEWKRPNGLKIQKVSVPIGVLGMIYESRPNVTIDAAALALKSHNAIILRGGSESFHSSMMLHGLVTDALKKNGLPESCVVMVPSQDRAHVGDMLNAIGLIDVIIPRGGKSLTGRVMNEAKMPVFAHLDGNCHIYVHPSAKPKMALDVIKNAKLRRTGVCGAAESLLFDHALDTDLAREIVMMLLKEGVEIVGDEKARTLSQYIKPATEEDWSAEYLDKKISVKCVQDVGEAVIHINQYGSHHTDCILAKDKADVEYFLNNVDSAIVLHNASTQFADGGEFGYGAEIGIGTGKLHARGPVGVKQLTTFKYKVLGDGQTRP